jgi:ribonucleoside-diphosphate reductase alpha chain
MSNKQTHEPTQTKATFNLPVKRTTGTTIQERLTDNAYNRILPARYLLKDEDGDVQETPKEMFKRVAQNVAEPDKDHPGVSYDESWKEFYNIMAQQAFIPNSPTLMNAGADLQQLSACFVVHPEDDMDSIFEQVHNAASIFQSGGGMGYPFHLMRPKGDRVHSTGGIASGPLSFQRVFDTTCGTIKQGGKRRGAQMGIMRVDHPDILRFITAKRNEGELSNFNISVGLTDDFMDAVKNDETYTLTNPRTDEPFETSQKTAEFYNRDEEWHPQAAGSDQGRDDNFWRDHAASFGDEIDQYDINLEPGEPMELPARFIWETLIDGAWRNGEPGLFMYNETNDMHSFDVDKHPEHRIEATNPCVTGDTKISTENGLYEAQTLYEQRVAMDVAVDGRLSDDRFKEASSVYKTGEKDVYKLSTTEGYELRLTADHRVMTNDGWKEAQHLTGDDTVHIANREGGFGQAGTRDEGHVLGWLVGDGQLKDNEGRAVLHFYDEDTELSDTFAEKVNAIVRGARGNGDYEVGVQSIETRGDHRQRLAEEQRIRSTRLYELAEHYGLTKNKLSVPSKVFRGSRKQAIGFLQGLFTADGSVQGTAQKGVSVRLSSSEEALLKDVQQLLLNFGVYSKVYTERRPAGKRDLPDNNGGMKTYDVQAQHDLVISKNSLIRFAEEIGFLRSDKQRRLETRLEDYTRGPYEETFTATVANVEHDGHEPVYDLTEPDTHSFIANGVVVHNCGEQPLENYEACNLGHINLSLLVDDKDDGIGLNYYEWKEQRSDAYDFDNDLDTAVQAYLDEALDMERFESVAKTGLRFLDNVVTMSDFPLDKIEEKVSSLRKVGLGLMGFAQMLIQLGIRYGSDESIAVAKEIQRRITGFSIEASHDLAKRRGAFSEWPDSKWADPTAYPDWFEQYTGGLDPAEFEDGLKLRNHNTTTIAPTGTTSMIANTSGGCEPIFSLAYYKNVAKDIQGEDMLVEFDDYFIKALEANDVDVEAVKADAEAKMENNEWDGVQSISDDVLPDEVKEIFATANQVSPAEHIDIQAAFQTYNHSGISKTCNFPNSATKDDVREAYMRAYDKGVKGMTVYRDGTREVQVMQTNKDNQLTDMDKVDMLAEIIDEFGGADDLLRSNEFQEVVGDTDLRLEDDAEQQEEQLEATSVADRDSDTSQTRERPKVIEGTTQEITTPYGDVFVTVNNDDVGPFEVFAQIGKAGGYTQSFTEGLGRMISLSLRNGADPEDVIEQLDDIRSPQIAWDQGTKIHSVPDAVAEALKRHVHGENVGQQPLDDFETEETDTSKIVEGGENPECPDCGGMLVLQEGCQKCPSCGWSKC